MIQIVAFIEAILYAAMLIATLVTVLGEIFNTIKEVLGWK